MMASIAILLCQSAVPRNLISPKSQHTFHQGVAKKQNHDRTMHIHSAMLATGQRHENIPDSHGCHPKKHSLTPSKLFKWDGNLGEFNHIVHKNGFPETQIFLKITYINTCWKWHHLRSQDFDSSIGQLTHAKGMIASYQWSSAIVIVTWWHVPSLVRWKHTSVHKHWIGSKKTKHLYITHKSWIPKIFSITLPKFNIAPKNWPGPKRKKKKVFQPSIFRCFCC